MLIRCAHCGKEADKHTGTVNRSTAAGRPLYCSRECAGLAKRKFKTVEQRKAEKSAYDAKRRVELADKIKAEKRAYHLRTYDPAKAAVKRKARMPRHVEYCRRPEYRAWKREYDKQYRAEKEYGEFAECFLLAMEIRDECLSRMSDYEIRLEKGTMNKALKRRRDYERIDREEPEICALGNLERGERR